MRKSFRPFVFAATLGLGFALSAGSASAITIDGNLSDWGVTVADGNNSNFSSPSPTIGLVSTFTEDQNDFAGNGGYVGPNYGGQNYDAEFMGVAVQGNTMYLAIVSGQRPDNGLSKYSPGDIYMTTPVGVVGIEVGGGTGGGAGGVVTEGNAGSTYNLHSNGYTQSYGTTDAAQTAGSIWANADWIQDPIAPGSPVQMDINGASTKIADADYAYTRNTQTSQHSVIELALDLTNLLDEDGNGSIGIHWSPSCGNDIVTAFFQVSVPITSTEIPEPGSALVWLVGVGMIGAMRARRKRR
ncbi:MAG: hypothetical protein ACI9JL_000755 [Paracoccaceae bacterium]|jgi:hypothetical protein